MSIVKTVKNAQTFPNYVAYTLVSLLFPFIISETCTLPLGYWALTGGFFVCFVFALIFLKLSFQVISWPFTNYTNIYVTPSPISSLFVFSHQNVSYLRSGTVLLYLHAQCLAT